MTTDFGNYYPPGATNDPHAPYNQPLDGKETQSMVTEVRYPNLPVLDHSGESHRCASNEAECLGCWLALNHGTFCEANDYRCCELDSCPDDCAHEAALDDYWQRQDDDAQERALRRWEARQQGE